MSCYSLNPAFLSSTTSGECLVTMSLDGVRQGPDAAFAALFDVQHHTGAMASIFVPHHVYQANADHLEQTPDFIAKDGHCSFDFASHEAALNFLRHLYGIDAPALADAVSCPAHLSTPPRLTRRPLSTAAFSPFGVMHMSKKQPVRVFLDQEIHSRYLIQAGTHGLTPSALGEKLLHHGLAQLERGDTSALTAADAVSPAPNGKEA